MSVNEAAAESVNCAFVRMSTSVGLDKVIDMAQKLGMRPNVAGRQPVNDWDVLTFTLGVISITPLEMANIDGDDRGRRHPPRPGLRTKGGGSGRQGRVRRDRATRHPGAGPRRRQLRGEHPPRSPRRARVAPREAKGSRATTRSARRARTTTRSALRSSEGPPISCRSSGTESPSRTCPAPASGPGSRTRSGGTS